MDQTGPEAPRKPRNRIAGGTGPGRKLLSRLDPLWQRDPERRWRRTLQAFLQEAEAGAPLQSRESFLLRRTLTVAA